MISRTSRNDSRRRFIGRAALFTVALPSLAVVNGSCQAQTNQQRQSTGIIGGGCDGCEGMYEGMPQGLRWQTTIASPSEPGERLEISGVIFRPDGRTPAPNVTLYLWQTDLTGHYTPAPNTTGLTRRHGHLRGWLKTNERGEYKFTTIKPAPYPNDVIPAHIHPSAKEPDKNEYYIDDFLFDNDPLLTRQKRAMLENRGGSGVLRLTKRGVVWVGTRNIVLGLNIPNYR